jgi:hypothetical protein
MICTSKNARLAARCQTKGKKHQPRWFPRARFRCVSSLFFFPPSFILEHSSRKKKRRFRCVSSLFFFPPFVLERSLGRLYLYLLLLRTKKDSFVSPRKRITKISHSKKNGIKKFLTARHISGAPLRLHSTIISQPGSRISLVALYLQSAGVCVCVCVCVWPECSAPPDSIRN